jgi:hypothetical protein
MSRDFFATLSPLAFCQQIKSYKTIERQSRRVTTLKHSRRTEPWPNCNSLRQNRSGRLDTNKTCVFYSRRSGALIALISQEGIRCDSPFRWRAKSGAAPATVGGESFSQMPLGFAVQSLGRRRRIRTREPGDLPEQKSSFRRAGRAIGAGFRCGDRAGCHTFGGRHG